MVRFARAKGYKAATERVPEEATPWHEMKQQMVDAQQKKVQPIKNVWDMKDSKDNDGETSWARFEKTSTKKKTRSKESFGDQIKKATQQSSGKRTKLKFQSIEQDRGISEEVTANTSHSCSETVPKIKKRKKSDKKNVFEKEHNFLEADKDSHVEAFQYKRKQNSNFTENQTSKNFMTRKEKVKAGRPVTRRKEFEIDERNGSYTVNIGGRDLELRRYDGFPVKAEDWKRLTELRKKLLEKGIPRDQLQATMKLERRRAEKAVARERKKVCFHCRQAGHFLSECPAIGESPHQKKHDLPDTPTTGLCFKCGSLEHTHFECKVVQNEVFKFAECFICGERGHISRQCPDNPNGLYPRGGGCSVCGDVTHFRKDCPTYVKEQQDSAITLSTFRKGDALEAIDEESSKPTVTNTKKKKKVIKFQ